jgi:hypothetical protein
LSFGCAASLALRCSSASVRVPCARGTAFADLTARLTVVGIGVTANSEDPSKACTWCRYLTCLPALCVCSARGVCSMPLADPPDPRHTARSARATASPPPTPRRRMPHARCCASSERPVTLLVAGSPAAVLSLRLLLTYSPSTLTWTVSYLPLRQTGLIVLLSSDVRPQPRERTWPNRGGGLRAAFAGLAREDGGAKAVPSDTARANERSLRLAPSQCASFAGRTSQWCSGDAQSRRRGPQSQSWCCSRE